MGKCQVNIGNPWSFSVPCPNNNSSMNDPQPLVRFRERLGLGFTTCVLELAPHIGCYSSPIGAHLRVASHQCIMSGESGATSIKFDLS